MSLLSSLKLDKWWKIVLWLGVLAMAASLIYQVPFVQSKHLFGLGIGLVLIGLSHAIAHTTQSWIKPPNVYTGGAALITKDIIDHNFVTWILFLIGLLISLLFLVLLVISLI